MYSIKMIINCCQLIFRHVPIFIELQGTSKRHPTCAIAKKQYIYLPREQPDAV
jgi:hypothetical protein